MKKSKRLWRTLLFFVVLAALGGSFAFPVVNVPVYAAPRMIIGAGDVVISEFRTRGSAGGNDEFVELFNPNTASVSIAGWILRRSSGCGTTTASIATIPAGAVLLPGAHYLIGGSSYNDSVIPDSPTQTLGVSDTGGIALFLSDGTTLVDQVGLCATTLYVDGSPLIPLTTDMDQSYERKLGGATSCQDKDDNFSDFTQINPSNPQNLSTAATPCIGVTNVTSSVADGTYTTGAVIDITITFSGTVSVDVTNGTPTLLLETGVTDRTASYVSGSGSASLSFSYTVIAGDSSADLDYAATNSLTLNGGTITGATGDAVLVLPGPGSAGSLGANKNIVIDNGVPPSVTINQATGQADPASATPINFTVIFSEVVSNFTTGDVTLTGTAGATTAAVTEIAPNNGTTYNVAVSGMTTNGTVIASIAAGVANDMSGNGNTTSTSADNTVTYAPTTALSVIINEVAWSGTVANSNDEWIELRNPGSSPVDITGWHLYGDNNTLNSVGNPDITLSGTIPAGGYFLLERDQLATDVTANQVYSSGDLLNTGERLYLKDQTGTTIDTANVDGGAWPAGTGSPTYASMERIGTVWVTYAGTIPVAHDRNSNAIKGTPGTANWISTTTITTITSDTPDPSLVNQNVTVTVTVVGGTTTPTGTVAITGANTNCTITLSGGTGSCAVKFTSIGSKTLTATYNGDSSHPVSNDTEPHQVSTTITPFRTATPVPPPPPQLVVINEFVPRPGHDWNNDGVVNVGDEYIELLNHGTVDVNLSGFRLDDEVNIGSAPYSLSAKVLKPGERIVYYGSETGLLLGDGGDGVRLLKPNGQLMDAYNYFVVGYPDQSYCRLPDNGGADDWNKNCYPTPGFQNSLSGSGAPPSSGLNDEPSCPIADTLPFDFVWAECEPFGINIWRPEFWDRTGWYDEKNLPFIDGKWPVFAD